MEEGRAPDSHLWLHRQGGMRQQGVGLEWPCCAGGGGGTTAGIVGERGGWGGIPSHCFQVALGVSLTPTAFPSGSRPPRELCGVGLGLKGILPTRLNVFWSQSCKASKECPNPLPPSAHKAFQGLDLAPRFLVSLPTVHSYTPLCLLQNSDVLRPAMLRDCKYCSCGSNVLPFP